MANREFLIEVQGELGQTAEEDFVEVVVVGGYDGRFDFYVVHDIEEEVVYGSGI